MGQYLYISLFYRVEISRSDIDYNRLTKDYLNIQERLYENMSIDDIYEAAKTSLSK